LLLSLGTLSGQTKPNFSGTWQLNLDKSDFGGGGGPPDLTVTIRHSEPVIDVTETIGGQSESYRLTSDGKASTNRRDDGLEMTSTGGWDKQALTFTTKFNTPDGPVTFSDRLWLENEGRVMIVTRHITRPDGESDWRLVFDKQKQQ
jgi:hypothetical protein